MVPSYGGRVDSMELDPLKCMLSHLIDGIYDVIRVRIRWHLQLSKR